MFSEEQKKIRSERSKQYYQDNKEKVQAYRREHYLKNKEHITKQNKEWRINNREKFLTYASESYHRRKNDPINIIHYILKHAKARAIKKQIDFNLTEEDIILTDYCPIMKVPFDRNTRRYGYSLDRIDPTQGYIKGNVWVISQIANSMKWDSSPEERIKFANWVLSLEGGNLT